MTKVIVLCDTVQMNQNSHTIRFVVPAPDEVKAEPGKVVVKSIITASFSDKERVKEFEAGKKYTITFHELPAEEEKKIAPYKKAAGN